MTTGNSYDTHVASIAPQDTDQQEVQLIAKNPGETKSYICEFFGMSQIRKSCPASQIGKFASQVCLLGFENRGLSTFCQNCS